MVILLVFSFIISVVVESDNTIRRLGIFQEFRNGLFTFDKNFDKVRSDVGILVVVVERSSKALVSDTGSTSYLDQQVRYCLHNIN